MSFTDCARRLGTNYVYEPDITVRKPRLFLSAVARLEFLVESLHAPMLRRMHVSTFFLSTFHLQAIISFSVHMDCVREILTGKYLKSLALQ